MKQFDLKIDYRKSDNLFIPLPIYNLLPENLTVKKSDNIGFFTGKQKKVFVELPEAIAIYLLYFPELKCIAAQDRGVQVHSRSFGSKNA